MDPQIQHDPRIKSNIKEALFNFLYAPVQATFRARLERIIQTNCLRMHLGHKSFTYKGTFYSFETTPAPRKANRLMPALYAEMDAYLADLKKINEEERPFVLGYINNVLNASNDLCDYLDLLPTSLHSPVQAFINACPCRNRHLTEAQVQQIKENNAESVDLIKCRVMTNLLI